MKIVTPQSRVTLGAAIDRSVIYGTLTAPTADRRDFHSMTEPLVSSRKSLRPWPRYRVPLRTVVTNVSDLGGRTRAELQSDELVRRPAGARRAAPATNSIDPPAGRPPHTRAARPQTINGRQIRTGGRSVDHNWPFGLPSHAVTRALRIRSRGRTRLEDRGSLAMHDRPARSAGACARCPADDEGVALFAGVTACDTAFESEVRDARTQQTTDRPGGSTGGLQ